MVRVTDFFLFLDGVLCGLLLPIAALAVWGLKRYRGFGWSWRVTWRWGEEPAWVALQLARGEIPVAPILATPEDMAALRANREAALASPEASSDAGRASSTAGSDAPKGVL